MKAKHLYWITVLTLGAVFWGAVFIKQLVMGGCDEQCNEENLYSGTNDRL